jgi:hypothetical protein
LQLRTLQLRVIAEALFGGGTVPPLLVSAAAAAISRRMTFSITAETRIARKILLLPGIALLPRILLLPSVLPSPGTSLPSIVWSLPSAIGFARDCMKMTDSVT